MKSCLIDKLIKKVEDKHHEMVSFYENMVSLSLRINQYNETIEIINDAFKVLDKVGSSEQYIKYILTVILIYLLRDDWVSAKSYLENVRTRLKNTNFWIKLFKHGLKYCIYLINY